ncbi:Uncharacterised protein [uncultured archaeon]|nr:Uncharacterised protein [uncultured archaeon]
MQKHYKALGKVTVKKKETNYISKITWIALVGTLFAGYLSYHKLFGKTCALTEGCTTFLGLSTCYYGFSLFFILLVLAFSSMKMGMTFSKSIKVVSGLGVLFSGYFAVYELFFAPLNILNGAVYSLLLPSCAYGLVLFVVIWILS